MIPGRPRSDPGRSISDCSSENSTQARGNPESSRGCRNFRMRS